MNSVWQEKELNKYCGNNMSYLRKLCDFKLNKIGGISSKDYEDFYSIALETLHKSIQSYDGRCKFESYLSGNIDRKFATYLRDKYRIKRNGEIQYDENGERIYNQTISLDVPTEDGLDLSERIASDFQIETELNEIFDSPDDNIVQYLDSLSPQQREIACLIMQGEDNTYIKQKLNLSDKEFNKQMKRMKEYDNSKLLKLSIEQKREDDDDMSKVVTTSSEKTKTTAYSWEVIAKKIESHKLRDNHPLQRHSGQWKNYFKAELISDILQGKALVPIIISEEIKDGVAKHWLIDGKQRCSNVVDYINDGFAISRNVQVYMIPYQTEKRDENGEIVLDEDGFPIPEMNEFDIRGKKFSMLPQELKDMILEYQMPVMLNLNCTKKDIAYDIARFNRCRPMNVAQTGWTGLEENFAELVDKIIKKNPMFKADCKYTSYTDQNNRSGSLRRMIIETLIIDKFKESFGKDFMKMCEVLSENANDKMFTDLYIALDRLNNVMVEEVAELFNLKDSFIWFELFLKFCEVGESDEQFIEFLTDFIQSVHKAEYDELSKTYHSKSKVDVTTRLRFLESCMQEYIETHCNNTDKSIEDNSETKQLVDEFCSTELVESINLPDYDKVRIAKESFKMAKSPEDAIEHAEDMGLYLIESVPDYHEKITKDIIPALIGFCSYVYKHELGDNVIKSALSNFVKKFPIVQNTQTNLDNMIACVA